MIGNNERIVAAGGRAGVAITEVVAVRVVCPIDGDIGSGSPFTAQGVSNGSNRLGIECYVELPSHYARNKASVQGCGKQISFS